MADSSFDIVSKYDKQEVANAVNTAAKEVANRYDFKNVGARVELAGEVIKIEANTEERCKAVLDVVETWLIKRGVSLKHLDVPEAGPRLSGKEYKLDVPPQGGHHLREREEDHQDHPRRGAEERQDADPGRRGARHEQVARRPPGRAAAAQGRRPRRRPELHQPPLTRGAQPTVGATGILTRALFWLLAELLRDGGHAVVTVPNYQSIESVPLAGPGTVSGLPLWAGTGASCAGPSTSTGSPRCCGPTPGSSR